MFVFVIADSIAKFYVCNALKYHTYILYLSNHKITIIFGKSALTFKMSSNMQVKWIFVMFITTKDYYGKDFMFW